MRDLLVKLRVGMKVLGTDNSNHWEQKKISSAEESSVFEAFAYAFFQMQRKPQKQSKVAELPSIDSLLERIQGVVNVSVPLGEYLVAIRETVVNPNVNSNALYIFVIGNESCDLDSAMSAIALAFFLSLMTNEKLLEHLAIDSKIKKSLMDKEIHVVPLLQIEMGDKKLKSESIYFMKENRLRWDDVLTMYVGNQYFSVCFVIDETEYFYVVHT